MKILHLLFLLVLSVSLYAVPARRCAFRAQMQDGTYQIIRFVGDEEFSYYVGEDGYIVKPASNGMFYIRTEFKFENFLKYPRAIPTKRLGIGTIESAPVKSHGTPRIPVILVNFMDEKMSVTEEADLKEYYDKYCNGTRDGVLYEGAGSSGAVRDYFVQQSDSLFQPEFTVIGPVTLSHEMAYYGANSGAVKDVNFAAFRVEALQLAMEEYDTFAADFDNDGDGTVDLAFFIYAGLPESDAGVSEDAIWPKESISPIVINGVTIAVVGCCSELSLSRGNRVPAGIGTMCHEVAHALGLPDEYDRNNEALGMSYWSLMDSGNYTNGGKTPCGLTGYERDFLGWRGIKTLTESTTVRMRPLEDGGMAYKVVNSENPDEYYILENRQYVGWDSKMLGHGMLVNHVDYDRSSWINNRLNTDKAHQRMTIIPANNNYIGQNTAGSSAELVAAARGQLYPGPNANDMLTDESIPASTVFTESGFMKQPIRQIRELDNGDIVFKFMPKGRLDAPKPRCPEQMLAPNSFRLEWDAVDAAESYRVVVCANGENGNIVVHETDSVSVTGYDVNLPEVEYDTFVCYVTAQADTYEDSPAVEGMTVTLPADAISVVRGFADSDTGEVYTLEGIRIGDSDSVLPDLAPGVYIIRKGTEAKKIFIH